MAPPLNVSIVIPTYQRCRSVERTLQALTRQTMAADDFDVVVSIDGSDDSTCEMIAEFQAPFRLRAVSNPHRGRAAACNAGIRASTGDLIVVLDDDMEPSREFVTAHCRNHIDSARIGVMGAVPIVLDDTSQPVVKFIGHKFNRHLEQLAEPGYAIRFRDFYTGNFSIKRDVLLDVGGFDEGFTMYGNEDGELALRLESAGVRLVYDQHAEARQHYEKRFATLARDNIAKGYTAVILARKHPEALQDLKLNTYRHGSRRWRLARSVLLRLSDRWNELPDRVIRLVEWLEARPADRLPLYYDLCLDYCYWLGARSGLRGEMPLDGIPVNDSYR